MCLPNLEIQTWKQNILSWICFSYLNKNILKFKIAIQSLGIYTITFNFLNLPRGAEWMIGGAYTPSPIGCKQHHFLLGGPQLFRSSQPNGEAWLLHTSFRWICFLRIQKVREMLAKDRSNHPGMRKHEYMCKHINIYMYTVYIFVDMSYIHPRIYLKLINFWDHAFMYDMILFYLPVYFWNSHMSCFPDFLFPFSAHTLRLQPHLLFHLSLGSKK